MNEQTLYIQLEENSRIHTSDIFLKDVATLWCKDKHLLQKCKCIKLGKVNTDKDYRGVYKAVDIVEKIQEEYPVLEIVVFGAEDIIVAYEKEKKENLGFEWVKAIGIFLIILLGAAFAIMTFNKDVNVSDVFKDLYFFVTGTQSNGFTIIEWMYSIGLSVGILVFYNHFSRKKVTSDPTPLEVEMRLYEQDINTAIIDTYNRNQESR